MIFTAEHRAKLSAAKIGVNRSEASKLKQRETIQQCGSHRARVWTLLSPTDQIIRTEKMVQFCAELGLSYSALRNKAGARDSRPITRGKSAGWSVLGCKEVGVLLFDDL
jgi:hypothetical protein